MNAEEMKKCPFCAEMIRVEAVKCRYCGSMLSKGASGGMAGSQGLWNRVEEGKKIAGVCTGIARQLDAPVLILPLRVFFAITTMAYFFGPILYIVLWMLMPAPEGEEEHTQAHYYQPPAGAPSAGASSPGAQPPVVDSYPGQRAHHQPPPPPMAETTAPAADNGEQSNGTNGMDEPPHKQPHSAD